MAIISLEGMRFYAYHGFYEEENIVGQDYELDVSVQTNIQKAALGDNLFASVNYETLFRICQSEMKKPAKLLETVVIRIAKRIQKQFDQVSGVKVKLRKLHPPLGGRVAAASVEYSTGTLGDGDEGGLKDIDLDRLFGSL